MTKFPPVKVTAWLTTSLSQSLHTGLHAIYTSKKYRGDCCRPEIITRYSGKCKLKWLLQFLQQGQHPQPLHPELHPPL